MQDIMRLVEQLNICPHRPLKGPLSGNISRQGAGQSTDFLRYKNYESGHALNRVDWRRYAKNRQVLTKDFGDVYDYTFVIAIDTSRSMACPDESKIRLQEQLTKAIAYNALYKGHPVILVDMGEDSSIRLNGDGHLGMAMAVEWLAKRQYHHTQLNFTSGFYEAFKAVLFFCLSDCWDSRLMPFIQRHHYQDNDFVCIRILSREELSPSYSKNVLLKDSETQESLVMHITDEMVNNYHQLLQDQTLFIKGQCSSYGYRFFQWPSDTAIHSLLIQLGR